MSFNTFWKSFNIFKYLSTPDLSPVSENRTEHLEQSLVAVTNGSRPEILVSSVSSDVGSTRKVPYPQEHFQSTSRLEFGWFQVRVFQACSHHFQKESGIKLRNIMKYQWLWRLWSYSMLFVQFLTFGFQFPWHCYRFQHAKAFSKDLQRGQGMHRIEPIQNIQNIQRSPIIINNPMTGRYCKAE